MDLATTDADWAAARFVERIDRLIWTPAQEMPDHPALSDGRATWTYSDLAAIVVELAGMLTAAGIRSGDRVMIVGDNSLAMAAVMLAVSSIDAWSVPVSPGIPTREIGQIRDHSGARRVLYLSAASVEARNHALRHGAGQVRFGPAGPMHLGPLTKAARPAPVHAVGSRQVAMLAYTSSAARDPKSVMLTHQDLLLNGWIFGETRELRPDDRLYAILPLSHVVGLSSALVSGLMFGCTIHVAPRDDAAMLVQAIAHDGVSVLYSVQSTYRQLLEYKALHGMETLPRGRLRHIGVAGGSLDTALEQCIAAELKLPLQNSYGAARRPGTSVAGDLFIGERLHLHLARLQATGHDTLTSSLEFEAMYLAVLRDACRNSTRQRLTQEPLQRRGRAQLVCDAIEARYDEVLSLDELSSLTGLDKFKLIREFKRAYGLSPHAYHNRVRVRRAGELILGGAQLAETAAAVGFADQAHMTRAFRGTVGYTPGALAQVSLEIARCLPGPSLNGGKDHLCANRSLPFPGQSANVAAS
jgi:acyl-CoA synthetase (AMP-forming)/AMP-acid ligase II